LCRWARRPPSELRERKLIAAIEALRVGVVDRFGRPRMARWSPPRTRRASSAGSTRRARKAAELVVDGRGFTLQGHENGFFIGPHAVRPRDGRTWRPTTRRSSARCCRSCAPRTFEEALELPRKHQYGNGVAIFTRNGSAAREFAARVNVGMVGINVPIPVPVAYHTFGGWKRSAFGDTNQHGMEGVKFWTKVKTVTQRWPDGLPDSGNALVIPTMG